MLWGTQPPSKATHHKALSPWKERLMSMEQHIIFFQSYPQTKANEVCLWYCPVKKVSMFHCLNRWHATPSSTSHMPTHHTTLRKRLPFPMNLFRLPHWSLSLPFCQKQSLSSQHNAMPVF
mmetsp:Transcript_16459/g.27194  ORF Transcript_16459/g.27194 Transcript_16459/m.27194 type:complete len:120 (+) Transcript_16459:215-574(+)